VKIRGEAEALGERLTREVALQAEQEVNLMAMQIQLLELHSAVRRLGARVGVEETEESSSHEELPRQMCAQDPVERYRAECQRMNAKTEELWQKRRALDAINPIGGLTEEHWREFDAEREAMRRRLATAGGASNDEAATA
jgi:hypothetical protein